MYDLALFSYVVVVGHYLSEWLIFKTSSLAAPLASPLIVGSVSPCICFSLVRISNVCLRSWFAATSLIWMINQYSFYVSA